MKSLILRVIAPILMLTYTIFSSGCAVMLGDMRVYGGARSMTHAMKEDPEAALAWMVLIGFHFVSDTCSLPITIPYAIIAGDES